MLTEAPQLTEITFTEEDADEEPCLWENCSKVATWIARYQWSCTCWPSILPYCEQHGTEMHSWVGRPGHCSECSTNAALLHLRRKGAGG